MIAWGVFGMIHVPAHRYTAHRTNTEVAEIHRDGESHIKDKIQPRHTGEILTTMRALVTLFLAAAAVPLEAQFGMPPKPKSKPSKGMIV